MEKKSQVLGHTPNYSQNQDQKLQFKATIWHGEHTPRFYYTWSITKQGARMVIVIDMYQGWMVEDSI